MKNYWILLISLASVLGACGDSATEAEKKPNQTAIAVETMALQRAAVALPVNASGNFTTDDETYLGFKIGGVIQSVLVNEGDAVRKGQLLATLDLAEINAGLKQAELGLEKAKRDYERASRLFADSVATPEQLQNAKTGLDIATEQVRQVQVNRQYAEIRAVSNGYVLRKMANPGQVVGPGTPVLQTNGGNEKSWLVKVALSDTDWARLQPGDSASVLCQALSGTAIPARLLRKAESADPYSGTYFADLSLNLPAGVKPAQGLYARVELFPSAEGTQFQIPFEYVFDAQGDEAFVFVTSDGKTARKQAIKLGKMNSRGVEVLQGLEPSMRLITSGSAYLKDQSPILSTAKP